MHCICYSSVTVAVKFITDVKTIFEIKDGDVYFLMEELSAKDSVL